MPYVSEAQRRFFHSPGAKGAGLTSKDVKHWDAATKGRKLPERVGKSKKKYKLGVSNKIKSYGRMDPNTNKIQINVKSHKKNGKLDKAELASTIKHEIMHVTHPKRTEKEVTKLTAKTKIPLAEQHELLKKLHRHRLNSRVGGLKRKFKMKREDSVEPGAFISKINSQKAPRVATALPRNPAERTAIMGAI